MILENIASLLRPLRRKSLARNTLFSMITGGMTFVSWSVLLILLGRFLSVHDFGVLGLAMAAGAMVALIPSYGFDLLVIREIVQGGYQRGEIQGNAVSVKLILTVVALALLGIYINVSGSVEQPPVFWMIGIANIILSFSNFFTAILKSDEDFHTETLVVSVQAMSQLILVVGIAWLWGISIIQVAALILFCNGLGLLISVWAIVRKNKAHGIPSRLIFNKSVAWRLTREAFPFAMQNFLGIVYFQADTLMIGEIMNVTSVGYYQAAMRFITGLVRVPMILINAFYPRIARGFSSGEASNDLSVSRLLVHFMVWIGGILSFLFFTLASPLIITLYTQKMAPSIPALQVLSFVLVVRFVASGYGIILTSCHRQSTQVLGAAVAAVVNISLNLIFVPRYGFMAAAWVSLFTNIVILILYAFFIKRTLGTFMLQGVLAFGKNALNRAIQMVPLAKAHK